MTKKHQNKQSSNKPLSPEKYIKTQARKLPIYECIINSSWKESMMCSILVSRKHKNGNVTGGVFLVDLYCLGVKEADCIFNNLPEEYEDFKKEYFPEESFEKIDYTLAHNIIFAGLEFADDYGFKGNKEFYQRAQYILEEDNDDIELMEIECGSDNKPVIIAGADNKEEAQRAYNHLMSTVGPDGFFYTDYDELTQEAQSEFEDDAEEYQEDAPIEEYIYEQPLIERVEDLKRFKELADYEKHTSPDDPVELLYLSKRLFYNYHGLEKIEAARNLFINFLDVDINDESIPSALSGTQSNQHDEKIEEILDSLDFDEDLKSYKLKKLANNHPDVPFYSYMHIVEMHINKVELKKIARQIDQYLSIYPNYLMLQLENDQILALEDKKCQIITEKLINKSSLSKLFGNRKQIHSLEYQSFHSALFAYLVTKEDLLLLDAFIYASNMLFPDLAEGFTEKELFSELSKVDFCKKTYL
ncbi:hypothetical protein E9993_15675 [Labilibacter sediminis]|nr:hypothetical protein E9993_15675 [Labilibacter sediminis]